MLDGTVFSLVGLLWLLLFHTGMGQVLWLLLVVVWRLLVATQ